MATKTDDPGFAVYVHWPFCASKCPYCDFNSHVRKGGISEPRYLSAYLREIDYMATLAPGREVKSVFFGGGTPSLMQPATVDAILDRIARHWSIAKAAEITLEANPTSVEAANFTGYRAAGVNRLSLGLQALNDPDLMALGRRHNVVEGLAALKVAKKTYPRVSFDLIYAREGQTAKDWRTELAQALGFADGHISLYQLTIEPGTAFATRHASGALEIPSGGEARAQYEVTGELCDAAGLSTYEISNYAAPGRESVHNLVYWRYGEYAGIGAGAHGRLVIDGVRHATATHKKPETWLAKVETAGHGLSECTALDKDMQFDECLLMGLRLAEGVDLTRLEQVSGRTIRPEKIAGLDAEGLVNLSPGGHRLHATAAGRMLLDRLILELSV